VKIMMLSELIKELQDKLEVHGDIPTWAGLEDATCAPVTAESIKIVVSWHDEKDIDLYIET